MLDPVSWQSIKDELIEGRIFYVGKRYGTIYHFINNFPVVIRVDFNTVGSDKAFTFTDNCHSSLSGKSTCELRIVFQPIETGMQRLHLTVKMGDNEFTEARKWFDVQVEAPVLIVSRVREGLPLQTELGKPYPIAFEWSVPGDRQATEVRVISKADSSPDFRLENQIEEISINKAHPFLTQGIFTPKQLGNNQRVGVILSYREGPDISLDANPTQVIERIMGKITGQMTSDFPSHIKAGFPQALAFTFYNEQIIPATGIQIHIDKD